MSVKKTVRRVGCSCGCPSAGVAGLLLLALLVILMLPASCGASAAQPAGGMCATCAPGAGGGDPSSVAGSGAGVGVAVRISLQPLFPWTPQGGFPTATWPYGQCTWFVVYEGHLAGSHQVSWGGNADAWYANAQAQSVATEPPSVMPEPGWIAVFVPGHGSDPEVGHVAAVVGVQASSGTYTVAEMNVLGLGVADLRTLGLSGSSPLLEGWVE